MLETSLPPPAQISEHQTITMSVVKLGMQHCNQLVTKFGVTNTTTDVTTQLVVNVYRIDNVRTQGYIPSKVWWSEQDDDINFLYYTSPTLPTAARPFGDNWCYAFTKSIRTDELIDYPIDARVLVDQVMIGSNMHYLFLFADDQMHHILTTDWFGNTRTIDIPEAKVYNTDNCDNI
jgi:hypothetical protein